MDTAELMFAMEVRKMAIQMQKDELEQVKQQYAGQKEIILNWYRDYPLSVFVKRAYHEITKALDAIREQQSEDSSAALDESLGITRTS